MDEQIDQPGGYFGNPQQRLLRVPSKEQRDAAIQARLDALNSAPTFLSPEWFAKLYGRNEAAPQDAAPLSAPPTAAAPAVAPAPAMPAARPAPARPALMTAGYQPGGGLKEIPEGPPEPEAPGALSPAQPAAPVQLLADKYRDRIGAVPKEIKGDLSNEQKNRLALQLWMGMMANSAKPGARALGAFGESGLSASKTADEYEKINRDLSREDRAQRREDIGKEFGFGEQDLNRGEREKHHADQIGILQQQIDQGKYMVKETSNGFVIIDQKTGAARPVVGAGGKPLKIAKDDRPAEVRLLEHLRSHPEDLETLAKLKGKSGDVTDSGQFKAAIDLLGKDMSGSMTPEQAAQKVRDVAATISGGRSGPVKPSTEADAHRQAKGARAKGAPLEEINARLQQWGYKPIN